MMIKFKSKVNISFIHFSISSLVFGYSNANAQVSANVYLRITNSADSVFALKKYQDAVNLYQKAFAINNGLGKVGHRYKVASGYALLSKPDSAFIELNKMANKGKFSGYEMITSDTAFQSLHPDIRWGEVIELIRKNKGKPKIILDNK